MRNLKELRDAGAHPEGDVVAGVFKECGLNKSFMKALAVQAVEDDEVALGASLRMDVSSLQPGLGKGLHEL